MSDTIMRGTKVYKEWQSLVSELEAENAALRKELELGSRVLKFEEWAENKIVELQNALQIYKQRNGELDAEKAALSERVLFLEGEIYELQKYNGWSGVTRHDLTVALEDIQRGRAIRIPTDIHKEIDE